MEPYAAFETLHTFRNFLYECFGRRADALSLSSLMPSSRPVSSLRQST
jgi:hypothetical protein